MEENNELTSRMLMLEQTTRVDQDTAIHVQNELKSLQEEIYQLKRELEFYQGVMDTTRRVTGLDIHGIYVEPLAKPNQYVVKLILTNVARNDRIIEGNLVIEIDGYQNNRKQKLNMGKLLIDDNVDLSFELKSFKRVEYLFELPGDFQAERVLVQVNPKNTKDNSINKIYDWLVN
jgi:hypothetical protein